jgi:hypothetical protein
MAGNGLLLSVADGEADLIINAIVLEHVEDIEIMVT